MNALEEVMQKNEETVERICSNVSASLIIQNKNQLSLQSTFDSTTTNGLISKIAGILVPMSRSAIRDLDPSDDLHFLRVNTKNFEYLVGPEEKFTLIVQQNH